MSSNASIGLASIWAFINGMLLAKPALLYRLYIFNIGTIILYLITLLFVYMFKDTREVMRSKYGGIGASIRRVLIVILAWASAILVDELIGSTHSCAVETAVALFLATFLFTIFFNSLAILGLNSGLDFGKLFELLAFAIKRNGRKFQ